MGQKMSEAPPLDKEQEAFQFPYQLDKPEEVYELPQKLVEISGLGLSKDGKKLSAIQDEDGIVFFLDKNTGELLEEIPFGKTGDYEGVEQIGETVYVIKSSGKIYAIQNIGQASQEVTKYKTPLNKEFDVEGLSYDATGNTLLIACKGQPEALDKETQFARAIYHFHLDHMTFDSIPAIIIDKSDLITYFDNHPPLIKAKKDGTVEEITAENLKYHPSAIGIHPITRNYYISSSKGKTLFIISPEGTILHIEKLKKKILPQPEGLVFDKDGTLFIANEGGEKKAIICRYRYDK